MRRTVPSAGIAMLNEGSNVPLFRRDGGRGCGCGCGRCHSVGLVRLVTTPVAEPATRVQTAPVAYLITHRGRQPERAADLRVSQYDPSVLTRDA